MTGNDFQFIAVHYQEFVALELLDIVICLSLKVFPKF